MNTLATEYRMEKAKKIVEWLEDYKRLLEQNKWIPVSEHLPEEFCKVLACKDNGSIAILYYNPIQTTRYPQGFSVVENNFSWRQNNVVAWMPIDIKPYKGGE